jgi:hypothetical protein
MGFNGVNIPLTPIFMSSRMEEDKNGEITTDNEPPRERKSVDPLSDEFNSLLVGAIEGGNGVYGRKEIP